MTSEPIIYKTIRMENKNATMEINATQIANILVKKQVDKIIKTVESISEQEAKILMARPNLLDRWVDQIGAILEGSVYGERINHFYNEKIILAKTVIDFFENELEKNKEMKYCLLIDSGTTMFHIFCEICEKMKVPKFKKFWRDRVFLITNNLPGVQHLMRNCRDEINEERSGIPINCLILPGRPLPVYGAVTGAETCEFLTEERLKEIFEKDLKATKNKSQIISFLTASYMSRYDKNETSSYYPVARGEGHYEIKDRFASLSDKIYLISPLTKFSFATVQQLNELNNFTIDEKNSPERAREHPEEVMYREIEIKDDKKKCIFFTTERKERDIFYEFSEALKEDLRKNYSNEQIIIAEDFKIEDFSISTNKNERMIYELNTEIPHERLRVSYTKRKIEDRAFIWDYQWISNPEIE